MASALEEQRTRGRRPPRSHPRRYLNLSLWDFLPLAFLESEPHVQMETCHGMIKHPCFLSPCSPKWLFSLGGHTAGWQSSHGAEEACQSRGGSHHSFMSHSIVRGCLGATIAPRFWKEPQKMNSVYWMDKPASCARFQNVNVPCCVTLFVWHSGDVSQGLIKVLALGHTSVNVFNNNLEKRVTRSLTRYAVSRQTRRAD